MRDLTDAELDVVGGGKKKVVVLKDVQVNYASVNQYANTGVTIIAKKLYADDITITTGAASNTNGDIFQSNFD